MSSRRFQVAAASLLLAAFATAQSRLSPAEAMALCFPDSVVTTDPTMLQRTERDQIAKASGEKAPGPMVYRYRAHKGKNLVAVGYVDSHRVRSKKQVLLVIIDTAGKNAGKVRRLEVLAFTEPRQYLPTRRFYDQFDGRTLSPNLREGGQVKRVAGATMTVRATTAAVRRVLATHQLLSKKRNGSGASR